VFELALERNVLSPTRVTSEYSGVPASGIGCTKLHLARK
jgi:hypothetical protein